MTNDEYAWIYQTCTEAGTCAINPSSDLSLFTITIVAKFKIGYFQDSDPARTTNTVPAFVNVSSWIQDNCVSNFGSRTANGPDVSTINNKYHGWHLSTSNVLFVNGQYDPWRALSVASDIDTAEPGIKLTTTIPASGTTLPNGTVFGYIVKNGLHCSDLSYNFSAVQNNSTIPSSYDVSANEAHELFASALSSWLPAYTKFAATPTTAINTATAPPTSTATSSSTGKSGAAREGVLSGGWALMVFALGIAFLA
jgi:hypothetical protein